MSQPEEREEGDKIPPDGVAVNQKGRCRQDAGQEGNIRRAEAEGGICRPPPRAKAACVHTVGGVDGCFQHIGQQDGKTLQSKPQFLPAAVCAGEQLFLCSIDCRKLPPAPGQKAKDHGKEQGQGGEKPPEKTDKLIRAQRRCQTGTPADDRDKHGGGTEAEPDGFGGEGIAARQVGQNGCSFVVEGGIDDNRKDQKGQKPPKGKPQGGFAPLY